MHIFELQVDFRAQGENPLFLLMVQQLNKIFEKNLKGRAEVKILLG